MAASSRLNVLILCTHNSARSQMGEALMRMRAGDRFHVHSAGLEPGRVHPMAVRAMEELGCDMSGHTSKSVNEYLGTLPVYHLIVVCDKAAGRCPNVWPGLEHRWFWPFEDPSAVAGDDQAQLDAFRRVRDEIDQKIQSWLPTLDERGRVPRHTGVQA